MKHSILIAAALLTACGPQQKPLGPRPDFTEEYRMDHADCVKSYLEDVHTDAALVALKAACRVTARDFAQYMVDDWDKKNAERKQL